MRSRDLTDDELIANAIARMKFRFRGLDEVCNEIVERYSKNNMHECFIVSGSEYRFGAYIFFNTRRQLDDALNSQLVNLIKKDIYQELEKSGRGTATQIHINFEFDSHENVVENYEGDYFNRLR